MLINVTVVDIFLWLGVAFYAGYVGYKHGQEDLIRVEKCDSASERKARDNISLILKSMLPDNIDGYLIERISYKIYRSIRDDRTIPPDVRYAPGDSGVVEKEKG